MAKRIKGITVKIGGDTTQLDKALSGVNKNIKSTQTELRDVQKLLKLDPKNTELLSQKQRLLASAISDTKTKLDALKQAESQLKKTANSSDLGRKQYDQLQREIIETENELKNLQNSATDTQKKLSKIPQVDMDKLKSGVSTVASGAAKTVTAGVAAIGAGAVGMVAAIDSITESTREYREDIGKLETAFTTAGFSSEVATDTYKEFYSVLGEEDRSVEAVNHLAKLTTSEEDLSKWTNICAGVWGTFGDSLPIEGLSEAANETAKTGAVTGVLADALNWAGVSEDEFNKQLAACSSEQERSALITDTLNGLYAEAAENYKTANAEVIAAQKAQSDLTDATAALGEALEPVSTSFKQFGADVLNSLVPGVQKLGDGLMQAMQGDPDAANTMSEGVKSMLTGLLSQIQSVMPIIVTVLSQIAPSLINQIISMLPMFGNLAIQLLMALVNAVISNLTILLNAAIQIVLFLAQALTQHLPTLIPTMISAIILMVQTLTSPENLSNLIHAALLLILALVQGIIQALPQLISAAPEIILSIITTLLSMTPEIIQTAFTLVGELAGGLIQARGTLIAKAMELLNSLFDKIKSGEVLDKAKEWGKDFIQGIINGIRSMIGKVGEAVKSVANKIASFLHFSRPDEGPLREYEKWMPDFMKGMAKGIYLNMPIIDNAAKAIAETIDSGVITAATPSEFDYNQMRSAVRKGFNDVDSDIYLNDRVVGRRLRKMGVVFSK